MTSGCLYIHFLYCMLIIVHLFCSNIIIKKSQHNASSKQGSTMHWHIYGIKFLKIFMVRSLWLSDAGIISWLTMKWEPWTEYFKTWEETEMWSRVDLCVLYTLLPVSVNWNLMCCDLRRAVSDPSAGFTLWSLSSVRRPCRMSLSQPLPP